MEPKELVPGTLIQSGDDFGVILSEVGGGWGGGGGAVL